MKIALLSLPRSRSECMFNTLVPLAKSLGQQVYYPTKGTYYYIDHTIVDSNIFCKIDTRTPAHIWKNILDHKLQWHVTTRDFESFCLSLAYAINKNKFHDFKDTEYLPFTITKEQYYHSKKTYDRFHIMLKDITDPIIHDYDNIVSAGSTIHIDKNYKDLCINYQEFKDWLRIDFILKQDWFRKWNCYSSWDNKGLEDNPLFSDIAPGSKMWYNVYLKGDSQDWHIHNGVISSGTRFLQIPEQSGLFEFKYKQVANIPHTQIEFKSTDEHRVTTHNSDVSRITVSWNRYK